MEFIDHFKRALEDAGFTLIDLPGVDGKQCKGALMKNPQKPWTEFTVTSGSGVNESSIALRPKAHVYNNQEQEL
eukprot:7714503-Pyramimonas_sp.AAC.1